MFLYLNFYLPTLTFELITLHFSLYTLSSLLPLLYSRLLLPFISSSLWVMHKFSSPYSSPPFLLPPCLLPWLIRAFLRSLFCILFTCLFASVISVMSMSFLLSFFPFFSYLSWLFLQHVIFSFLWNYWCIKLYFVINSILQLCHNIFFSFNMHMIIFMHYYLIYMNVVRFFSLSFLSRTLFKYFIVFVRFHLLYLIYSPLISPFPFLSPFSLNSFVRLLFPSVIPLFY